MTGKTNMYSVPTDLVVYDGNAGVNILNGWTRIIHNGSFAVTEVEDGDITALKLTVTGAAQYIKSNFTFDPTAYSTLKITARKNVNSSSSVGSVAADATVAPTEKTAVPSSTEYTELTIPLTGLTAAQSIYWDKSTANFSTYISKIVLE